MVEGVIYQHACTMLEQLWLGCFDMVVEQFAVKPEPEHCVVRSFAFFS